jgi:type VI secretion system secreted protein Hcp
MQLYLRPSAILDEKSGGNFLEFNLKLVMIQDVSWSGSVGDDIIEETVVLQYGAMKIDYYKQDYKGSTPNNPTNSASWSRVLNTAAYDI